MVNTVHHVHNTDEAVNRRIEAATGDRIRRLAHNPPGHRTAPART